MIFGITAKSQMHITLDLPIILLDLTEWVEFQIITSAILDTPVYGVKVFLNGIVLHHNNTNKYLGNCWSVADPGCKS